MSPNAPTYIEVLLTLSAKSDPRGPSLAPLMLHLVTLPSAAVLGFLPI